MPLNLLPLDKLIQHMQARLLPFYLLSGEEPLLLGEARDLIRRLSAQRGFHERKTWHIDNCFTWKQVKQLYSTRSLLSPKSLIELFCQQPISKTAFPYLQAYINATPTDQILLIICGKFDRITQKDPWLKTCLNQGMFWPVWPLDPPHLYEWIARRLNQSGLQTDSAGVNALAELTEGNLAACVQAIEFLHLSQKSGFVPAECIYQEISNQARFDPFKLVDAALQGQKKRCLHIVDRLRETNLEPNLVLGSLVAALRQLSAVLHALVKHKSLANICKEQRIFPQRQFSLRQASQRHSPNDLALLFSLAYQIDRVNKGLESHSAWNLLKDLSLAIASGQTFSNPQLLGKEAFLL